MDDRHHPEDTLSTALTSDGPEQGLAGWASLQTPTGTGIWWTAAFDPDRNVPGNA